jgi:hypothetical protein
MNVKHVHIHAEREHSWRLIPQKVSIFSQNARIRPAGSLRPWGDHPMPKARDLISTDFIRKATKRIR